MTTTHYRISSTTSGHCLGDYEADNPAHAMDDGDVADYEITGLRGRHGRWCVVEGTGRLREVVGVFDTEIEAAREAAAWPSPAAIEVLDRLTGRSLTVSELGPREEWDEDEDDDDDDDDDDVEDEEEAP